MDPSSRPSRRAKHLTCVITKAPIVAVMWEGGSTGHIGGVRICAPAQVSLRGVAPRLALLGNKMTAEPTS